MAKKLKHFLAVVETEIGDICGYLVCPKKDVCDAIPMFIRAIGDALVMKETAPKRTKLKHIEGKHIETLRDYLRSNPHTSKALEEGRKRMIVCWMAEAEAQGIVHSEWGHA